MRNKMYKISLVISILSLVLNVICFFRLYNIINNKGELIELAPELDVANVWEFVNDKYPEDIIIGGCRAVVSKEYLLYKFTTNENENISVIVPYEKSFLGGDYSVKEDEWVIVKDDEQHITI